MASKYKGRSSQPRSSRISTAAASGISGDRGRQRTLSGFLGHTPKSTETPPHLSPIASGSPSVKADMVPSTSRRGTNAGEKRKKAEVIDLTSDEDDPPLKRRKPSVDSLSSACSYQVSKPGQSKVAKYLQSGSPVQSTIPNLGATTPCSSPKPCFRGLEVFGLQSPLFEEERGRSGGPPKNSLFFDSPSPFLPDGAHRIDCFGVDMESGVVPSSQASPDDLPLAFPPNVPSALASPLQTITPSLQPNSPFLFTSTPKSVQASQQVVPSSATPSDLRQSRDIHIEQVEAPPVPLFTPYFPSPRKGRSQINYSLPPSSLPRFSESPSIPNDLAKGDVLYEQEPFPALPHLNNQNDRIESSQLEESFEFAFPIPPPPHPSRKPLRRRTPRISVDGAATRNLWSDVFDVLAATQKNDPIAAQSPRKRAASSPVKPAALSRARSQENEGEEEEEEEGTSHEQSSFHPFHAPSPAIPSWPSHPPSSPLRLLLSQTSQTPSTSPTKRPVFASPPKVPAFPSPSAFPSASASPRKFPTIAPPASSRPASPAPRHAPFATPPHPTFPSATGPEGSPSAAFGLAYLSPPKLPYPGGSTPASQHVEEAGVSQYPESLADEPLPDFLVTFGESQGMEDWINDMRMQE